jgi:histidinol dehydrogenase
LDFVRFTSVVALDSATTAGLAPQAALLARAEGLMAHAGAAALRAREAGA